MEGLEPGPEAEAIAKGFIEGELSREEYHAEMRRLALGIARTNLIELHIWRAQANAAFALLHPRIIHSEQLIHFPPPCRETIINLSCSALEGIAMTSSNGHANGSVGVEHPGESAPPQ